MGANQSNGEDGSCGDLGENLGPARRGGVVPFKLPSSRAVRASGRSLLTLWDKRQLQSHIFGVVRHAERADTVWAYYNGARWTQTDDFLRWPVDPPLSDFGVEAAQAETALRVAEFAAENGTAVHIVVTSPYFRCVQTAAEICKKLGPSTRLLIDRSLGEIFGPKIMGDVQPSNPVRPMESLQAYCRARGVRLLSKPIGQWPIWPEDLKAARRRYAERFLTYLQRSKKAKRNFLLVTHGDCVGAALSMMPSQIGRHIEKVDYGGMFLSKRQARHEPNTSSAETRSASHGATSSRKVCPDSGMSSILPSANSMNDEPADESEVDGFVWKVLVDLDQPPASAWDLQDSITPTSSGGQGASILHKGRRVREFLPPEPPKSSDGWEVKTHDIVVREIRPSASTSTGAAFNRKVSALAKHSKFTTEQIGGLLGELSDTPLGDTDEQLDNAVTMNISQHFDTLQPMRIPTSVSTYLFGASELGGTQMELPEFTPSEVGGDRDSNDFTATLTNTSIDISAMDALLSDERPDTGSRDARRTRSTNKGSSRGGGARRRSTEEGGSRGDEGRQTLPPRTSTVHSIREDTTEEELAQKSDVDGHAFRISIMTPGMMSPMGSCKSKYSDQPDLEAEHEESALASRARRLAQGNRPLGAQLDEAVGDSALLRVRGRPMPVQADCTRRSSGASLQVPTLALSSPPSPRSFSGRGGGDFGSHGPASPRSASPRPLAPVGGSSPPSPRPLGVPPAAQPKPGGPPAADGTAQATVALKRLEDSLLMRRRMRQEGQPSGTPAAVTPDPGPLFKAPPSEPPSPPSAGTTPKSPEGTPPIHPLGSLQGSMLMRRRQQGKAADEPVPRVNSAGADLHRALEKAPEPRPQVVLFGNMQNSSLAQRRAAANTKGEVAGGPPKLSLQDLIRPPEPKISSARSHESIQASSSPPHSTPSSPGRTVEGLPVPANPMVVLKSLENASLLKRREMKAPLR